MSDPIGPGDIVECISSAGGSRSRVVAGVTYCVRKLVPTYNCRHCGEKLHLGLSLTSDATDSDGWCPKRFRPLKRRDDALIQRLLHPTLADLGEVV